MNKFWNFIRDDAGERVLRLEGPIDEDDLWGDAITPQMFRDELEAEEGDVTVWLNSPGGNVFAADQIYTMLCDHKGKITVKIDAIAASAASVIAMAGDRVLMSPVGMLMIHDPMTIAMGNTKDMEAAIKTLDQVKESIINAYQRKTGLSRNKIANLMSDETWMNAKKAVELGFADEILFAKEDANKDDEEEEDEGGIEIGDSWQPFHARRMVQAIWAGLMGCAPEDAAIAGKEHEKPAVPPEDVEPSETGVTDKKTPEREEESGDSDGDSEKESGPDEDTPPDEGSPDESGFEDPDEEDPKKKKPEDSIPEMPVIGMDGKTKDGAMPYELLERELQFLR